jgi:hypothetical protein
MIGSPREMSSHRTVSSTSYADSQQREGPPSLSSNAKQFLPHDLAASLLWGLYALMIKGTLPLRFCVFLYRSLVQLQAHARLIRQGQAAMPGDRRLDVDHLIDAFP